MDIVSHFNDAAKTNKDGKYTEVFTSGFWLGEIM